MGYDAGEVKGRLVLDKAQWDAVVNQVRSNQQTLQNQAKQTGGIFKGMWAQVAAGIGVTQLVAGGIRAVKAQVSDTIQKGREFEKAWANVTTMLDTSAEETLKLKKDLQNLSPTLGGTTELAAAMYQTLSASIEPSKAIEFLGVAAKAAKAGLTEAETAVDALSTVINAYGLEAESATEISDMMFQSVKSGKLTYEEMATSLGTVVPVAAQVGIGFDEIAAAMATMTRQGIDAGTSTMQLRQVMMAVLKPSDEAAKLAEQLGIDFSAAGLKAKGLSGFIAELSEKTGGNVEQMAAFIPNVRALSGVMALSGEAAEGFANDLENLRTKSGQTEEAFEKQMQSIDFWIDTFNTQMDTMKIKFYEGFVDPFKEGISTAKELDEVTQDLNEAAANLGYIFGLAAKFGLDDFLLKLNQVTKTLKVYEMLTEAVTLSIQNKQIPTLKGSLKLWAEHKIETERVRKEQEAYNQILDAYTKGLRNLKPVIKDTGSETGEAAKKTKDLKDELNLIFKADLETRILQIKTALEQFRDVLPGTEVIRLKEEIKKLEEQLKSTDQVIRTSVIPSFMDIGSTAVTSAGIAADGHAKLTESIKADAVQIRNEWTVLGENLLWSWGSLIEGLLDKNSTFTECWNGFIENTLASFRSLCADLAVEWVKNFIQKQLVKGAQEGATAVNDALDTSAKAMSGVGKGLASIITTLATAIATAATTLAAAAPALLTVGAIALAIYGGFQAINKFLGSSSGGSDRVGHWIHETRDRITEIQGIMFGEFRTIFGHNFNVWFTSLMRSNEIHMIQFGQMNTKLKGQWDELKQIVANTAATVSALGNLTHAQHGAYIDRGPELVMVGEQSPRIPEIIMPEPQFIQAMQQASQQGGASVNLTINGQTQELDLKGSMRNILIDIVPEMTRDGRLKIHTRAFTEDI